MLLKSKILLLPILLVLLVGCNDSASDHLKRLADQKSLDRFDSLPPDSGLLLCLQSYDVLGELPDLGSEGREVGRFGPASLVIVSRNGVPALAKVNGLDGLVLWGDDKALDKIDPMLRSAMLSAMTMPTWRETEFSVIGTFADGGTGLKEALAAAGARPGSVNGGIATFDATSEVIFDILAWDNLRQLKKPSIQQPTQGLK